MNKSIIKRLRKIERYTTQPRWRLVVKDIDGSYGGECGKGLSKEQFQQWTKQQDKDTQIIIVELSQDVTPQDKREITFKVENHAEKSVADFLRGYDELIQISCLPGPETKASPAQIQEIPNNTTGN